MPRDGTATRTALIDAAERQFAERGLHAVSLREVSSAAGQANNGSAQYHFGSREGLIDGVLDARMSVIEERRAAIVEGWGNVDEVPLEELARAQIVPLAETGHRHPHYLGFLAHLLVDKHYNHLLRRPLPRTASLRVALTKLDAAQAHLSPRLRERRRWLSTTLMVHTLAAYENTPSGQPYRTEHELIDDLVAACTAILEAPR